MRPTDPPPPPGPRQDAPGGSHGGHDRSGDDRGSQGYLHNPEVAHEHSDVKVRPILWFLATVAGVAGVSMLAMWGLFVLLERQAAGRDPVLSPLAAPAGQQPPAPRLLTNELDYLRDFRREEDRLLHEYGWVDEAAGVVRIPIGEAKRRLLERGLPVRAGAAPEHLGGYLPGRGDPSSGRAITWERPPHRGEAEAAQPKPAPGH